MSGPILAVLICLVVAPAPASAGPKVDVVQMRNGDRLTCEIKKLNEGSLTISTDPIDTVSVHWGDVAALTSPREFEIRLQSGDRLYGTLGPASRPGELTVAGAIGPPEVVGLLDVVAIVPIGSSLWNRMDGNLDLGFSFAEANVETHWTLNGSATYRGREYELTSSIASQLTTRSDAEATSRDTLTFLGSRLFERRWFGSLLGQFQQNQELQLDLRTVSGAGAGRVVGQSSTYVLSLFSGLVYTHERFVDQTPDNSAEIAVGSSFHAFTIGSDDFSLTNNVVAFFAVTGRARTRMELQSAWRHKFLSDFYWSVNAVESFDSSPPTAETKKNDFSVSLAIGWSF